MISKESHAFWLEGKKNPQFGSPASPFNLAGLREGMNARQTPADKAVQCLRTQVDHVPCEWAVAPGADPDVRVLYLHGGGYVSGSGGNYLPFAADISAAAKCAVLTVDYRLAPEHPFPAGLEDSIHAYQWMRTNGPTGPKPAKATFIAGDSAGGGMTLATLLAMRDRKLPLPNGGMPLSAFADLTCSSESIRTQADKELYMYPGCLPQFVELYASGKDLRDPLISPVFGDYTGIPPLLIQAGDYEVIRDDSIRVAEKAKADGVDVTLEIWPGQVHVFQIRGLPESRQAVQHIAEFIHAHC
ncbi:MAG: Monoterpene epsilon-lactone hydrolase [Verrucomicrobiae bacterium]|nr:Monoterpene epsilon-lactone hydrolase [Verrucomicrobiae bacterium]